MTIQDEIREIANLYIGQTEKPGNMGWDDMRFQQLMTECGWNTGQAWCAYFTEMVWKLAYGNYPEVVAELDKLFSAGAIATYNNFSQATGWKVDKKPSVGSVVIWQYWHDNKPTWKGHAGIVTGICGGNEVITVEGNTNAHGGREGIEVAEKRRMLSFDARSGLVMKGFIHPKEI